ncbi:MAG: hypothetical protein ACI398_00545 [Clostridium sp.]
MLYVYPDNFIVPVIFTDNIIDKKHKPIYTNYNNKQKYNVEKIKEELRKDDKGKFRDDCEEKYYEKLQKKLVMDWNQEGESAQKVIYGNILNEIDTEYAYSETEKI